ncbi:fatty acid desaturase family protein [Nocardioides marmoraquaticus]
MTVLTHTRAQTTPPVPHPRPPLAGPTAHLTPADVERIGRELDAIRQRVVDSRGAADAAYIRRVIATQRRLELVGRACLLASRHRPAWVVGTVALTLSKVLENMEIGHNVLHGQWDWMRDPKIHSTTWEWDHVSPASEWKRSHNNTHHVHTNVLGKDNDLGYGILRVDESQEWRPRHLVQPLWNAVTACVFEYGIAMYDLEYGDSFRSGTPLTADQRRRGAATLRKAGRQVTRDFVLFPALSGRYAGRALLGTVVANVVRNVWSHSVIMCGHFPEGVETFEIDHVPEHETQGEWYLRQMLGSADISGSPLLHLLTGNLSHQIEHHLFPDLPSNRYAQIAPAVRDVMERHGLRYHSAPLLQQVGSAWHKVVRLSLPEGGWREAAHEVRVRVGARVSGRTGRRPRRGGRPRRHG